MSAPERDPLDPALVREWSRPYALDGLARLRREVVRVGKTQPLPIPPDSRKFDEPKPGRKVRLPKALGGGIARLVRWRPDGDRLVLTRPGLQEPFEVAVVDIPARRGLIRRRNR